MDTITEQVSRRLATITSQQGAIYRRYVLDGARADTGGAMPVGEAGTRDEDA